MIEAGLYHDLVIDRLTEPGAYLRAGAIDILLPKRFIPDNATAGATVKVFVYHDSEGRLIATTQRPFGVVGDIRYMKVVSENKSGAFVDWGLMKDLFVPLSKQKDKLLINHAYFFKIYRDEQTGRVAATQKFSYELSNEHLTVSEGQTVELLIHRETEIGYEVIINSHHIGLLHFEDAFLPIKIGKKLTGTIRKIRPDHKIDVHLGERGYEKVSAEAEKILKDLTAKGGYLPFNDKSDPEEIYRALAMSKKTFKMAIGQLYKSKKISFTTSGIKLLDT